MSAARVLPELTTQPEGAESYPLSVPSKSDVTPNAQSLVDVLLDRMSAKEAYVYLYGRTAVEEEAMKLLLDRAVVGLDGTKEVVFGATLEMRSKPKKYIYHDGRLEIMQAELENKKADVKAREKFNQSIPPGGTIDPESGEHIQPPTIEEQGVTLAVELPGGGR